MSVTVNVLRDNIWGAYLLSKILVVDQLMRCFANYAGIRIWGKIQRSLKSPVKIILEGIRHDWKTLKNEKELEILKHNTNIAKYFTIIFGCAVYTGGCIGLFILLFPLALDIVIPLNESRPFWGEMHTEFFIDEQKYLYVPIVYLSVVLIAGMTCLLAVEGVIIFFIWHSCGLLQIVSYRIKSTLHEDILRQSSIGKRESYEIRERMVDIVNGHRRTFEYVDFTVSAFGTSYLILLCAGVATLATNLFQIHQAVVLMEHVQEIVTSMMHSCIIVVYMFVFNHLGQKVLDRTSILFENIYDTHWYQAPISIQKLVLIIMNRAMVNKGLALGGIFTASYESFARIVQMSVSYFMVICSTL